MIHKANINWTAKQLCKMMDKNTVRFDNAIQRGYVWDDKRKSLLIHSMMEGYPIPAFYAAKSDGQYDMLDGKQRSNAIHSFVNGEYLLVDVPSVEMEDGTEKDVNGASFTSLDEELKDRISDYSLTVYYFDGITDDEINETFYRLNNGKNLTAIELTRVKAKSIEQIRKLASHELFHNALTEKALNRYTNEDIVIKSWAALYTENPSFETKEIRPLMRDVEITEEQMDDLNKAFDFVLRAYGDIKTPNTKEGNKTARHMFTRTHLISLVTVAMEAINKGVSETMFVDWIGTFFNGKRGASSNELYNAASGSGSAKRENVGKRLSIIKADFEKYIDNHKVEEA